MYTKSAYLPVVPSDTRLRFGSGIDSPRSLFFVFIFSISLDSLCMTGTLPGAIGGLLAFGLVRAHSHVLAGWVCQIHLSDALTDSAQKTKKKQVAILVPCSCFASIFVQYNPVDQRIDRSYSDYNYGLHDSLFPAIVPILCRFPHAERASYCPSTPKPWPKTSITWRHEWRERYP